MADQTVGNVHGLPSVHTGAGEQRTNISGDNNSQHDSHFDADLGDIAAMRTRLAAIDAGLYTDAYLNTMTYNDMVYAIRVEDAPTTIKQ